MSTRSASIFSVHFRSSGPRYYLTLEMVSSEKETWTEPQRQLDVGIVMIAAESRGLSESLL